MILKYSILIIGLVIFSSGYSSDKTASVENGKNKNKLQIIGAPYISASSDIGIEFGILTGIAKYPELISYLYFYHSTEGYTGIGIRGERSLNSWRLVTANYVTHILRKVYPDDVGTPEPYAKAAVDRLQIDLSVLRKNYTPPVEVGIKGEGMLEFGPDLSIDISKGKNPIDTDGRPLNISDIPRFQFGSIVHLGFRSRYRTTSAQRPLNGIIIDGALRVGRASGDALPKPRLDMSGDLKVAVVKRLSLRSRLYLRGQGRWQLESPPPNQYWLGGEKTLRGQPDQREFGRRVLCGRAQYHFTTINAWDFPFRLLHNISSLIPVMAMDIETVAFYDIGSIGDPDFGWHKTRQGYGGGIRFVFPPEMVFSIDVAGTPHGGIRYYVGLGETR